MKKTDAIEHLRAMAYAIQKVRSVMSETGIIVKDGSPGSLEMSEEFAALVWPWVWGDKCILPTVVKVLDKYEETGNLDVLDYFNLMYIATRFEPMIEVISAVVSRNGDFPTDIDVKWMSGWDKE